MLLRDIYVEHNLESEYICENWDGDLTFVPELIVPDEDDDMGDDHGHDESGNDEHENSSEENGDSDGGETGDEDVECVYTCEEVDCSEDSGLFAHCTLVMCE